MNISIDLVRALREPEYREEISVDLEGDVTDLILLEAADEIECLQVMAYAYPDKHKPGCYCINCIPF